MARISSVCFAEDGADSPSIRFLADLYANEPKIIIAPAINPLLGLTKPPKKLNIPNTNAIFEPRKRLSTWNPFPVFFDSFSITCRLNY